MNLRFFVETLILTLFLFCRLLAPTLTLCMVCESACLLVYVIKMYLHNRRRTLEDLKTQNLPRQLPREHQAGWFFFLSGVQTIQKTFVQMTPLRNI